MAGDILTPPAAQDGEPAFTPAQVEEAQRLMEEEPRIDAALKNFLSMKLAEGLAPPGEAPAAPPAAGYQGCAAGLQPEAAALQGCARVLLKTLNALTLPGSPQWSSENPQGKEESGFDYIARIGNYRVVHALWSRCLEKGQKPARLLGRSSLAFALPLVMQQIDADFKASAAAAKAPEELLRQFLDAFKATLSTGDSGGVDDAALTWTTDLKAAIALRHAKRKQEAAERVERAVSNENFTADLRSALGGGVVGGHDEDEESGPFIEEVTEKNGGA